MECSFVPKIMLYKINNIEDALQSIKNAGNATIIFGIFLLISTLIFYFSSNEGGFLSFLGPDVIYSIILIFTINWLFIIILSLLFKRNKSKIYSIVIALYFLNLLIMSSFKSGWFDFVLLIFFIYAIQGVKGAFALKKFQSNP